jgi:hypothetical protein
MSDNMIDKLKLLIEPFEEHLIEWRIQRSGIKDNKPWAIVVPYIKKAAIEDRLDIALGPQNWKCKYTEGPCDGVLCGIYIKLDGEWVGKWDGADNTQIEAVKGGLTDSFKRSAMRWGIGRYLCYCKDDHFANIKANGKHRAEIKGKTGDHMYVNWDAPKLRLPSQTLPESATTKSKSTKKKVEPPKEESHPLGDPVTDFHKGIGKCKNLTQFKDWWEKEGNDLTKLMDNTCRDQAIIMKDEMKEAFLNNK